MAICITRRAAVAAAFGGLLLATMPSLAADDPAIAFAKSLYALHNKWGDVVASDAAMAQYLTAEFAAVVKENASYSSDLDYAVDYDPLTQSQDWDLKGLKFAAPKSGDLMTNTVVVTFSNSGRKETVRLSLLKTAAGWRLADLFDAKGASLLQEYRDLNTAGRAVKAGN
ncbi:MAG TPA: hypothetical protein VFB16_10800 [Bauldia sp.]|nr:hypothetical protein [Bauldia sp.]